MTEILFEEDTYLADQNESVLDCLLRHGKAIPHACKAGVCQACMIRSDVSAVPDKASKGLRNSLKAQGYALACQWVPEAPVTVRLPSDEELSVSLRIQSLSPLNPGVMRLRLAEVHPGTLFHAEPGQYLTLTNPEGVARSYSIANNPEKDGFTELHIARTEQGLFTGWLFSRAQSGDLLQARGPAGDCYYQVAEDGDQDFPLLLAGTGTGLAPLYGLLHDALALGHRGPITLFHGAANEDGLYYVETLRQLEAQQPRFSYRPCLKDVDSSSPLFGDLTQWVPAALDKDTLARTRVYLCGNPAFVHAVRKQVFLKGVKSAHIFSDPFLERPVTA